MATKGWSISFDSPLRTFTAYNLDQVAALVKSAEDAAHAGSWVVLLLTYESAPAFDHALQTHYSDSLPLAWAAVFAEPATTGTGSVDGEGHLKGWEPRIKRAEYYKGVNRIQELIACGDTYQVNYTFPLVTAFKGDPRGWYNQLCLAQGAEYCAYLDLGSGRWACPRSTLATLQLKRKSLRSMNLTGWEGGLAPAQLWHPTTEKKITQVYEPHRLGRWACPRSTLATLQLKRKSLRSMNLTG
ncbi:MAG: hypothetical protein ACREBG_01990, partial [Pyrinomonadaceae bacterium]